MSTEKLLKIKKQIDEARDKKSEITGQIKSVVSQMEQMFNVSTLADAELKLNEMGKDLDEKEEQFQKELQTLENGYDWN